ncbi:hypothetical protein N7520_001188 [Penicillium odoratum]|uniref:uncharacterized protein n=1 Tax=Penicillium odoratum TaxID=1167516 RepID=UPI002547D804|nr:uncharacterized protein N7520_001188 [Penicillium odoratum]KAJ5777942.1 hypothetical protein N7520_001188 [Penicillium odoratum]
MAYLQTAGKTAPRLAEDILLYDAAHPPSNGRNLLSQVPPVYPERHDGPQEYISPEAYPDVIKKRADEAFASQPDRLEGVAAPLPITVLDNLRLYLTNALRHSDRSKPITQGNKRFMVSFGVKDPKAKRAHEFELPPAPFYEDLGTVEDMSSELVVKSYEHQVQADPSRAPLYLNCLKAIGTLRGREDWEIINQAVQLAYSEGRYTEDDVTEAYRYFGLQRNDPNLTQEAIIGKFYAFLSSTNQETEARRQMWLIGQGLGSERIKSASEDRVSTVEQAQVFLGVDDHTPDDFIITMYTAKINDNPLCKDLADKAVQLIAESRKSDGLSHFIKTGETVAGEMDIGDAYRMLQIPDRTVDGDAVMAAYTICVDENPGQAELYNRALRIISRELDNPVLKNMAGVNTESEQNLSEWPVGLQNIGNTCYLNSLLQFYFSIKPYRDMVLNIEKFQMDTTNEASITVKKVGSRKVSGKEIERSLRFLTELRVLFRDMISSKNSSVTPSQELARLTLISPGNEAAIRRRSTISASKTHGLGDVNGAPVLGPLGPPQPIGEDLKEQQPTFASDNLEISDVGSEATLVSESNGTGATAPPMDAEPISEGYVNISPTQPVPPTRAPPVPPRPAPEIDPKKQLIEEVEIGAQQDVTEVINNVLFQSQCAIKPREVASDGEQVDHVKDMFYGQTRSYITTSGGTRSKDERWCDIKVNVALGPRDIYDAIDGAFDVQKISVENAEAEQYGSITRLPPILQIQVQRVQFDPVKKTSYKSTNHLQLSETIYMDRYMDTTRQDRLEARRQCWEWKKSLASIQARQAELLRTQESDGLEMATLFREAMGVLDDLNIPGSDNASMPEDSEQSTGSDSGSSAPENKLRLIQELEQMSEDVQTEFQALEQQIQTTKQLIADKFADSKEMPYQLYAVFVHRGSVSFGHYWIYIKDFQKNIWRKYNDEYVTEVQNLDEIFANKDDTNPPTPYFLVYINELKRNRMVDPVCRDIVEDPQPEVSANDPSAMEGILSPNPIEHAHQDYMAEQQLPPALAPAGESQEIKMNE